MIDLGRAVAVVAEAVEAVDSGAPYAGLRLIDALRTLRRGLEDNTESVVDPDALGYRNLLVAVVRRAIEDWVLYRDKKDLMSRRLSRDAYIWIFHDSGTDFMSFINICHLLGADPDFMRRGITHVTAKQLMGRPAESRRHSITESRSALLPRGSFDADAMDLSDLG